MDKQRINRIKEIIKSGDIELIEARARLYPVEFAQAQEELKQENDTDGKENPAIAVK
jgi:hypothetical protein